EMAGGSTSSMVVVPAAEMVDREALAAARRGARFTIRAASLPSPALSAGLWRSEGMEEPGAPEVFPRVSAALAETAKVGVVATPSVPQFFRLEAASYRIRPLRLIPSSAE